MRAECGIGAVFGLGAGTFLLAAPFGPQASDRQIAAFAMLRQRVL
jgi:hypothetical protein